MMRDTWFDCELNEDKIKDVDELMGMYEMSVGRGANFLINIGPNRHGLLPEADAERLLAFGAELKRRYGKPVEAFGPMQRDGEHAWSIQTHGFSADRENDAPSCLVNRVVVMEDLAQGEAVREFRIYAHLPGYKSQRICLYKGDTIGHKAICCFPTMRTPKLTVEITSADGDVSLRALKAYYAAPAAQNPIFPGRE